MSIDHVPHQQIEPVIRRRDRDATSRTPLADAALELAEAIACGLGVILLMAAVYTVLA